MAVHWPPSVTSVRGFLPAKSITQMSVSLPLRAVLLQAKRLPSCENSGDWLRALPSVSSVVPRDFMSNQCNCQNSLPPTSLPNTNPSSFDSTGGASLMAASGSG